MRTGGKSSRRVNQIWIEENGPRVLVIEQRINEYKKNLKCRNGREPTAGPWPDLFTYEIYDPPADMKSFTIFIFPPRYHRSNTKR